MNQIKKYIKKIVPQNVILIYHYIYATLWAFYFGYPTKKMVVIGITGTKGKTTTANFIWSVLQTSGLKTGLIGTANIRMGDHEILNTYHMTMPGPHITQKLLYKMYRQGCTHVVMEVTSEGLKMSRNIGIFFDVVIFTNLSPEHLPSHNNSFELYKETKGKLFKSLYTYSKQIDGKKVPKISIINIEDPHGSYYYDFPSDKKISYGYAKGDIQPSVLEKKTNSMVFQVSSDIYTINMIGDFNILNALPAIIIGKEFNIPTEKIQRGISSLSSVPGRMELINEGQNFTVLVDYAHEKLSMDNLLRNARDYVGATHKVIVLFGAQGGGRDKNKRKEMGILAAEHADYVLLTADDSYEEDTMHIMKEIFFYVEKQGKILDKNVFLIEDRREAIKKAFNLAQKGDIVLLAGKGAEQTIILQNKHIPWDDRAVARELLKKDHT